MFINDSKVHKCFICGETKTTTTHGFEEKDKTKHWEYLCYKCHCEVHPEFDKRV